jgi:hypothetical protein
MADPYRISLIPSPSCWREQNAIDYAGMNPTNLPWVMLALNALIQVVVAVVTVHLALGRFHRERWWERKADAYSRIVESLYAAIEHFRVSSAECEGGAKFDEKFRQKIDHDCDAAFGELRKAQVIGAYIISNEVAKMLDELMKRPRLSWNDSPHWEVFKDDQEAYAKALVGIREIAKKDLRISSWW